MSTGRVGIGVIGAGVISTQYLENMAEFPDLELRSIADLDTDRARAQATRFSIPAWGSVDELLADPTVEIVVDLTIPAAHQFVNLAALAAGKHVWCEKPIAIDRDSARRQLDAAAAAGLRLAVAPDTFLGGGIQTARRIIESGAIGAPISVRGALQTPGPDAWHPNPDFLFREGAGPLMDMGPYYLTAMTQLVGSVVSVSATAASPRPTRIIGSGDRAGETFPVTVPTTVEALLRFESGASGSLLLSADSHLERHQLEVVGTEGTLVVPDPNLFTGDLELHRADGVEVIEAQGVTTRRGTGVAELAQAIRGGRPERSPGSLAAHILDVMLSIASAAELGTTIEVTSRAVATPPLDASWAATDATLAVQREGT